MKVLLLNIDSKKFPNLALKKVEMWHQQQGDEVTWDMPIMLPIMFGCVDIAYASCIFSRHSDFIEQLRKQEPNIIVGGTGCIPELGMLNPLPVEIEMMKPKLNFGFTTRGCIRHCKFCLVPLAEGDIKEVGDIYDLWDRQTKNITLFDNNILALPDHFTKICRQLVTENLGVDFNQGLDIRLLDRNIISELNHIKMTNGIRFAFDFPELEPIIRQKVALLRQYYNRKYIFFYVLVGFNTTFEEDLHRLNVLKELGCRAYVMRYENTPKEKRYVRLAEWANQFWTFAKYDFNTFCKEYERYKCKV